MEVVRDFMHSSTIHGLSHVAANGRLVRLLWIYVVIAGFTGAAVMIYQSFSSWSDSPISTTIETLLLHYNASIYFILMRWQVRWDTKIADCLTELQMAVNA